MDVVESASKRRACVRCATAKARCTSNGTDQGCDRCRRLKRECILEETPRRKKQKQSTRVKALEEKVETLLNLLGPDKVGGGNTNSHATVDTRTPAPTEDGCPTSRSAKSTSAPSTIDDGKGFDVIESGTLSITTADALLNKYKRVHSKYFPFVIVAPEVDAGTLRVQSPVLFLAVMTTCVEGDHTLQRRLGVEMKRILSERIIVGNERDLDLLQGLLVLLGWNHYHFSPMRKQLYMLLQMAVGLVIDLDLDRLAIMRKELAMTHTTWIDNCCHILDVEQELPTDIYVTALVNARRLVQTVGDRFSYGDVSAIRLQNDVVIEMSVNSFKKTVEQLESTPAFSYAHGNYSLILELKALLITIHEAALYRDRDANSPSQNSHLWDLLTSARAYLHYVLSIPRDAITVLPATFFNLLPYALIVLSTVSRLPSTAGWDSSIAKREADVVNLGLRVKTKFGDELSASAPNASIEQKDVWAFFSRGIGALVSWHQRCETSSGESDVEVPISSPSSTMKCGMADTMTAFTSMWIRKPIPFNIQEQMAGNVGSATEVNSRPEMQPDTIMSMWDDEAWQSIMDDFSMFPTTTGIAPVGLY
ncbi:hypothetical protein H2200_003014 [Cladophialophora chaetospira]|uniref:Zn(2)-C6 fungal-type domain-containing protein n=1 Tax=Cladophialophora chaetospira TaxID=386627 RepID=A0AA38XGI9_9EURO|nr:hypothetical protein H2200_003014 [Cladophialophora chaetospira]